ncbi:MAG: arylamine N-acetyltransferase [Ilumatobacter sp.]
MDVDAYLDRIGFEGRPSLDLPTLARLQQLHMTAVPFENLDIALGTDPADVDRVTVDAVVNVDKIVRGGRGGWCFEVNGAFAVLLEALGFHVVRLGAAVLLSGPSRVVDHLALEVQLDEAYLVDVGFGESFTRPLALNRTGPQDGGNGTYEFFASPEGTTLTEYVDEVPEARYRFKRVGLEMADFVGISASLQRDETAHWRSKPFATRLLDGGPDRVTLTRDALKFHRAEAVERHEVAGGDWNEVLDGWFGIRLDDATPRSA